MSLSPRDATAKDAAEEGTELPDDDQELNAPPIPIRLPGSPSPAERSSRGEGRPPSARCRRGCRRPGRESGFLVLLCTRHHTMIHKSEWVISMADGFPLFHPPPWVGDRSLRNLIHRPGTLLGSGRLDDGRGDGPRRRRIGNRPMNARQERPARGGGGAAPGPKVARCAAIRSSSPTETGQGVRIARPRIRPAFRSSSASWKRSSGYFVVCSFTSPRAARTISSHRSL